MDCTLRYSCTRFIDSTGVLSFCTVLISGYPLCPRSWPHLRGVGGTCCRWCMRNRRGGPSLSRAMPVSAACGLRWGQPMGSSERLRILCSSLSGPSTVTGITKYLHIFKRIPHIFNRGSFLWICVSKTINYKSHTSIKMNLHKLKN